MARARAAAHGFREPSRRNGRIRRERILMGSEEPLREIWTAGHSNRTQEEFIALLLAHGVQMVADVRAYPWSRRNPQFNREMLQAELARAGLGYLHAVGLGGMGRAGLADSPNAAMQDPGIRAYTDYCLTDDFRRALGAVLETAAARRVALMCAEASPYGCHRRIICDHLTLVWGWRVWHILDAGRLEEHRVSPEARLKGDTVIYLPVQGALHLG